MPNYDFGSLASPSKQEKNSSYDFGGLASSASPPKNNQSLSNQIPGNENALDGNRNLGKATGDWDFGGLDRVLDAVSAGAMSVPVLGIGAGMALKGLGEAPLIARGASKYTRPILEAMKPSSLRELTGLTAGGAAAGAAGQAAKETAKGYGFGAFGQNIAEMIGGFSPGAAGIAGREAVRSASNIPAKILKKTFETPFSQEGANLVKETGIPLTPGQQSGNKTLLFGENAARQSFLTSNQVAEADKTQAKAAIDQVKKIADSINVADLSKAGIGERLQEAVAKSVKNLDYLRDKQAGIDYSAVRSMANGKPIISYKNTVEELNKIIQKYDGVVGDDAVKISSQAKKMLKTLSEDQPPSKIILPNNMVPPKPQGPKPKIVDVEEARQNRSFWSKASKGNGNIFNDVSPDANRTVAARLAKAVSKDFDDASNSKTPIAEALKKANKNYSDYSQSIEYVKSSALGKLLGKGVADAAVTGDISNTVAGEKVAQRFLTMTPSEVKKMANILNVNNPEVLSEVKSFIIRDALKDALDVSANSKLPISYNKLIKGLGESKQEYLNSVGFSNKEVHEINNVVKAMQRSGDRSGANTSNTSHVNHFIDMLGSVVEGGKKLASTAVQATVMRKIANSMTTKEGRDALLTLTKFDPKKQASREITKAISIFNSSQDENESSSN